MNGLVVQWKQCISRQQSNSQKNKIFSQKKEKSTLELCDCLIEIFGAIFGVSINALKQPARSAGEVNRVRQIAMYVAHVVCRLSMSAVGEGFGRDRTTVLHACHLVEDMRDDAEFDRIVAMAERVAIAAVRNRWDV